MFAPFFVDMTVGVTVPPDAAIVGLYDVPPPTLNAYSSAAASCFTLIVNVSPLFA
jgi:hypothetical protein